MPSSIDHANRTNRTSPTKRTNRSSDGAVTAQPGVNLVVLHGTASAPAEHRTLGSGATLTTLSVRVPGPATDRRGRATSVPVAVWDPPAWLDGVDVDDPLVVVGRLQRRFFRAAGGTGARVEVVAALIGRGHDRRRVDAAERRALAELAELA